jgi:ATP/maltotriose-dependent transcriptional regulator MalT
VCAAAERLPASEQDPRLLIVLALAAPAENSSRVVAALQSVAPDRLPDEAVGGDPTLALHLYALAVTAVAEFEIGVPFQDAAIVGLRGDGRLGLLCRALASHGYGRLVTDDWRRAEQAAAECLELTGYVLGADQTVESVDVLNVGACLGVLGTVAANRGDVGVAEALIEEAVRIEGAAGGSFCSAQIEASRAALALSTGRALEAFQHASRLFDPADPACHWGVSRWRTVLRDLADAAALSGNAAGARRLVAEVLERATGTDEFLGTTAHVDAVLAEDDIESRFRHAQEVLGGGAYSRARLDLAFGAWLRRARRPSDARPHLRAAVDGFEAMSAITWAERARQELRASGETLRSRGPDRRDDLSPQEMQIAQLAAEGLTNREIAERLFLSHRTVGAHLYRIFPKLGITSRTELRDILSERGEKR